MSGTKQAQPFGQGGSPSSPQSWSSLIALHSPRQPPSAKLLQGISGLWHEYPRGQGGRLSPQGRYSLVWGEGRGLANVRGERRRVVMMMVRENMVEYLLCAKLIDKEKSWEMG